MIFFLPALLTAVFNSVSGSTFVRRVPPPISLERGVTCSNASPSPPLCLPLHRSVSAPPHPSGSDCSTDIDSDSTRSGASTPAAADEGAFPRRTSGLLAAEEGASTPATPFAGASTPATPLAGDSTATLGVETAHALHTAADSSDSDCPRAVRDELKRRFAGTHALENDGGENWYCDGANTGSKVLLDVDVPRMCWGTRCSWPVLEDENEVMYDSVGVDEERRLFSKAQGVELGPVARAALEEETA